jgi:hypothetical protein
MHVPLRGSILLVWLAGSLFLGSALGLGLLLHRHPQPVQRRYGRFERCVSSALILSGF